jgi:galactonate dehydratase
VKIVAVETFLAPPRWLFCRVETDEGIVGWGEPVVEGRAETVRAAVHELTEHLLGQDPLRIEDTWQVLTKGGFYRGGPVLSSAVAGIDQALWDIAGKHLGVPVHTLLGGHVRDRARVYTWVGGDEPAELGEGIQRQVEAGFTAVKMNACGRMAPLSSPAALAGVVARAELAREILGDSRDFALDFHGRVGVADAVRLLPLLEPTMPLFVEEAVLPEHVRRLPALVGASTIPLALGERCYSRHDFVGPLQDGVRVVQPDVSHAGGISELRRIAALAETWGAVLAPHCPLGPVALAASLQVAFATPNFLIQEQSLGIHYNVGNDLLDYVVDPSVFTFRDGYVERPVLPGLGVSIDENAVRAADRTAHRWRSPVWRRPDGSFTEW